MNYNTPSGKASQSIRAHLAVNSESIGMLAQATGISESTIKRRLKGLSSWTIDELMIVAAHFGATLSEMLVPTVQARVAV